MASNQNVMYCRKFYLNITSAENLPNVREIFQTRAYAKVLIRSDSKKMKSKTKSDDRNDLNPEWSQDMTFDVSESGVQYYGLSVVIKLYTARTFGFKGYIGEVHMMMKDLYDYALPHGGSARQSLPIKQGRKETEGILNICYSFGEVFEVEKNEFMNKVKEFGVEIVTQVLSIAKEVIVQAIVKSFAQK